MWPWTPSCMEPKRSSRQWLGSSWKKNWGVIYMWTQKEVVSDVVTIMLATLTSHEISGTNFSLDLLGSPGQLRKNAHLEGNSNPLSTGPWGIHASNCAMVTLGLKEVKFHYASSHTAFEAVETNDGLNCAWSIGMCQSINREPSKLCVSHFGWALWQTCKNKPLMLSSYLSCVTNEITDITDVDSSWLFHCY